MANIKLIGYSSDDLADTIFPKTLNNKGLDVFAGFVKTKKQKNKERQAKLFTKQEPIDNDEWFCYLVDGEKWYYKVAQNLEELQQHHKAEFLGIGRPIQQSPKAEIKPLNKKLGQCCYCEVWLTQRVGAPSGTDRTREHIIPKSQGGKGKPTLPCCYSCNQEKADLPLPKYIACLRILLVNTPKNSPDFKLIELKINNATKINSQINNL
jgi:hypothetical protein